MDAGTNGGSGRHTAIPRALEALEALDALEALEALPAASAADPSSSFEVLEFLPEPVFVVSVERLGVRARFRWSFANRAWRAELGLGADDALRDEAADHLSAESASRHLAHYARALREGCAMRFEELTADGGRLLSYNVAPVPGADGHCTHLVVVARDETDHRAVEAQLLYQSRHDVLTGLANRVLLVERLHDALQHAARVGATVAVLFLDVDNFKVVNDSLGHEAGDRLFAAAARRVEGVLRFG
ncbi:MAG: hypothetical protein QOI55_865, partial [Actinomycetota bacterium]|nr:hypothetical protein [Actinomycetota bacterium]